MKGTVTGADIFEALLKMMTEMKFDFSKLIGITTDGAPAMVGEKGLCYTTTGTHGKPWSYS